MHNNASTSPPGQQHGGDVMVDYSTSPTHEHWQSLSCLTDSTEQSAPVHFDMSNRAKLPRGIDKIRPHIEQIDNVPLLVSLFTDCTPSVIREMLHIMQDFEEVVCVVCSSANAENMGICLQADCSLAIEPLYPQVCQSIPAYVACATSPSPIELSRALNSLSCALSARREDPLAIYPLVMHARHYTRSLWSCTQFWLCCNATLTVAQLLANIVMLPPLFRTGHLLWLCMVVIPVLSVSLVAAPTDPNIMRTAQGKEHIQINAGIIHFVLWCYGLKFLPAAFAAVLSYFSALSTYCHQICLDNCTCSFYYLPQINRTLIINDDLLLSDGWMFRQYTMLVAQHSAMFLIIIHFVIISITFVNRHHSIWIKGPQNNVLWICCVVLIFLLHTIFATIDLLVNSIDDQLGFLHLSYLVFIFTILSTIVTFLITEFIKWKEIKVNLRYQRRARLDFGTKLGMNSPF